MVINRGGRCCFISCAGAGFGSRGKDWDLNCRCQSRHTCFSSSNMMQEELPSYVPVMYIVS